jgi:peptidoglycan/xylan/chitin deacetylase (PgdA/CDA1 family)
MMNRDLPAGYNLNRWLLLALTVLIGLVIGGWRFASAQGDAAATPAPTATWRGPVMLGETPVPPPAWDDLPADYHPPALVPGVSASGAVDQVDGSGWDGTLRRVEVPILMYHYISVPPEDADIYRLDLSVTPENFRAQMQYLADNGYSVISLYDLNLALRWGTPLPPNPVVLTFDDGYVDVYENAFPILQEFGFTGTFFVITARLDEGHPAYLSWAQAQEMAAAGMSIESHTKDHPNLQARDADYLYYQIVGSLESIEANLGHRPQMFSYPAGRWDEDVLAITRAAGVWLAVITENGIAHTTDSMLLLRRVRISGETDLPTFAALVRWAWGRSPS